MRLSDGAFRDAILELADELSADMDGWDDLDDWDDPEDTGR